MIISFGDTFTEVPRNFWPTIHACLSPVKLTHMLPIMLFEKEYNRKIKCIKTLESDESGSISTFCHLLAVWCKKYYLPSNFMDLWNKNNNYAYLKLTRRDPCILSGNIIWKLGALYTSSHLITAKQVRYRYLSHYM